ncbi:MAG: CARDB domain-containing protein [Minicystis sp.]
MGNRPDLVVTAVSAPPLAAPGGAVTVTVTVCNQGLGPNNGTGLDVRLSSDGSIGPEDAYLGSTPIGSLDAGQCTTASVNGNAYVPDGTYQVGAVVDPGNGIIELIEGNNTFAGGSLVVGNGPNLVVTAVTGPASVLPGNPFTASVEICNQGTMFGAWSDVEVRLSADTTIDAADPMAGYAPVGYLDPGECTTMSVNAYAYVAGPDTAYYLGAIVDPYDNVDELIESDNAKAGSLIGVGNQPDLVVSSVTGPASATPGSPFTASVKVCNQGTTPSSWADVELHLSADTTIDASDPSAGFVSVGYLDPGQCQTASVNAYANPGSPGVTAYYLGAIVDRPNAVPELIESNNTATRNLMGVGNLPDLVVSSVTAPASAMPGSSFTASVKVCNQGTAPSSWADVELHLSTDTTITVDDPISGFVSIGYLDPGQCQTASVNAYANASGPATAYYLGAIVDRLNNVPELIESNNTAVSSLIGIGNQPDLIIASVTGPASVLPGNPFTASVKVCNQGTTWSSWSDVELRLSADTTINIEDPVAGYAPIGPLDPGQCQTASVNAYAYVTGPGTAYYLGVTVDRLGYVTELLESNNVTVGGLIGVGNQPDLVVSSVTGPASALPGSPFTASVKVCNQGTTPSSWADVELHLSADTNITVEDPIAGFVSVGYLDPGQCQTANVNAYASPGSPGVTAYYLGAIVDRPNAVPELIESNNTTTGSLMGVGNLPDLIIASVTGPASAMPSSSFTASVKVCNQGTAPSSWADVELHLSTDTNITVEDPIAGFVSIGYLDPGQCQTASVNAYANASGPATAYYLGAIVDRLNNVPELIESNNTAVSSLIGIGNAPDLVVASVTGPASVLPGNPFTASVKVCNQGTTWSSWSDVELRLSADTTITIEDPVAGYAPIGPLDPGQCQTVSANAYAYVSGPGTAYYLGVTVDRLGYVTELLESNNVTVGGLIGVGNQPDLVVSSVTGPASAMPGSPFTASVKVCNQGTAPSSWADVELHLSADTTITVEDPIAGFVSVGYLDPGQCQTASVNAYANPGSPGVTAYYLGAIVDRPNAVPELIESNNTTTGSLMGVGNLPDLIIASVTGPASAMPSSSFTASVKVCNQGTAPSSWADVELHLSTDTNITVEDPIAGFVSVGYLDPGQCQTTSVNAYANASGPATAYYLGAIVDRLNNVPELIESNNTAVSSLIGIGNAPDLVVSSVTGPASVLPGNPFTASVKVCNQGTTWSSWSDVELRLSADTTITIEDPVAGYAPVGPLDPGQCQTVSANAYAYVSGPGTAYYLGVTVDRLGYVTELLESNNVTVGGLIGVGNQPDLVVSSVTGPASAMPGSPFTASVKVCNQGTTPSSWADVELHLSADTTITVEDPVAGFVSVGYLDPGQCQTASVNAYASPGSPGVTAYYLGAIVDRPNAVPELIESNNTTTGSLMGVGNLPDLVISEVTSPASAMPNSPFTASVKVCNQGTAPSSWADVELHLSTDTNITFEDPIAGFVSIGYLDPGQCQTASVNAYANASGPATAYYLGAIVDRLNNVPELIESNNVTAGNLMGIGNQPDLVVSAVTTPATVQPGGGFLANVTVCNQGTSPSYGTDVELRLSIDDTIGTDDVVAGNAPVGYLDPGQCTTVNVNAYASVPEGVYFPGATVDRLNYMPELIESNNVEVGDSLTVDM